MEVKIGIILISDQLINHPSYCKQRGLGSQIETEACYSIHECT